ncbi:hypothetical protein COLO4_33965 [Corchorus olitorius]|uniref:Uncharacterized protein n=1 Tax=Corchorus olitorius TaxID=93759 RepID=A0A1R3GPR1_9ROSI|nr:hypothetical protein COLO4_33965 [Corchorus olitorius]
MEGGDNTETFFGSIYGEKKGDYGEQSSNQNKEDEHNCKDNGDPRQRPWLEN